MIGYMETGSHRIGRMVLFALTAGFLGACATSDASETVATDSTAGGVRLEEPTLEAVRAATERFMDVEVALAEGYVRDPMNMCDTAEMMGRPADWGVMGIHYVRPDLLGIDGPPEGRVSGTGINTDFTKPSVLIYEPQRDGSLALVAVENLVFIDAWEAAGHREPPMFHGRAFDRMVDDPATEVDEAHVFEPHYDLHVWLYRENPRGLFAQYNPNATCEFHRGGGHQH